MSWRLLAVRLVHLNVGLLLFGLSIALMLQAHVGLGPWDVYNEGLARHVPVSIGMVIVLTGVVLVLATWALGRRPGLGTLVNMLLVGPWVDVFLAWPLVPETEGGLPGASLFAVGLLTNGLATGLYITAGLGAGPRDGFVLAIAQRLAIQVRVARTGIEAVVLATGWLLGGTVGIGTVVFALCIGPLMQWGLRITRGIERWYAAASERARARR